MPLQKTVISDTPGVYECFPCLTRTASGKLITVYRESDSHVAAEYTHLVMRASLDDGATWSDRRVLVESFRENGVLFKWNCPRVGQLADGRVWILCDGFDQPPGENSRDSERPPLVYFWWSEDDGESWTGPVRTTIAGIVPDKLVVTRDGTWLVAAHYHEPEIGNLVQYVYRSTDRGETWDQCVVCRQEGLNPCEASIIQLPDDGLLVCYLRENSGMGWPGPKCLSHDDGVTWEGPYDTDMVGCHRPVAGFLPSGQIMITHRHTCRGIRGSAKNFFAFKEPQESARATDLSQQGGTILPLDHDRWEAPDQGYSGWVALPDGRLFVVNYIRDMSPLCHIRGYWLSEQDF
jgi:sialidase-1